MLNSFLQVDENAFRFFINLSLDSGRINSFSGCASVNAQYFP